MRKFKSILIPVVFSLIGYSISSLANSGIKDRLSAMKTLYFGTYINNKGFLKELSESILTGDTASAQIQISALSSGLDLLITGLDQITPLSEHEKISLNFQPINSQITDKIEDQPLRKVILK